MKTPSGIGKLKSEGILIDKFRIMIDVSFFLMLIVVFWRKLGQDLL